MIYDMTKGSPFKAILSMTIPAMIGNIFQQLYGMVDAVIVGRYLGQNALAAVGATSSIYSMVLWFVIGTAGGFATVVAQDFGSGNYKKMRERICTAVILAFGITLITTLISVCTVKHILIWMNTPDEIMEGAYHYITVILGGLTATMIYNLSAGISRAMGDAKTPLIFLIMASILNIVLDIVLIRNFHMGPEGAAYATVLSQAISGVLCVFYIYKKFTILHFEKDDWKYRKEDAAKLLKIGLPLGLNGIVTASGIIIFQVAVNGYGTEVVVAFAAGAKVEQLATQLLSAFCITMTNFVGQNFGAGKIENMKKGIKQCFFFMLVTAFVGVIVLVVFGGSIVGLFIKNPTENVIAFAAEYLNCCGIFLPVLGTNFVFRSAAQGMGDARIPIINGIVESVSRGLWAVYLCTYGNFHQLCLANPLTWALATILMVVLYRRKIRQISGSR